MSPLDQALRQSRFAGSRQAADQDKARFAVRLLQLHQGQEPMSPGPSQSGGAVVFGNLLLRQLKAFHFAPYRRPVCRVVPEQSSTATIQRGAKIRVGKQT